MGVDAEEVLVRLKGGRQEALQAVVADLEELEVREPVQQPRGLCVAVPSKQASKRGVSRVRE